MPLFTAARARRRICVTQHYRASLDRVKQLRRMKAQGRGITIRKHACAAIPYAERMGPVVDNAQIVARRDGLYCGDIRWIAERVHGDDCRRFRRHTLLDLRRIQIERLRIDIGEHGTKANPTERAGRSHPSERRRDHFFRQLERPVGNLQRERPAARQNEMRNTEIRREALLELSRRAGRCWSGVRYETPDWRSGRSARSLED